MTTTIPAMPTETPADPSGKPRVTVLGLGYIGLPTAALVARSGFQVHGVDVDAGVVDTINSGRIHIEEVDLDGLVGGVVARGDLRAGREVMPADTFIIAVPTPFGEGHVPDIGHVMAAARAIAPVLKVGNLVILESTSPIGTTDRISQLLETLRPDLRMPHTHGALADICIAYCPERVLPGRILVELVNNDRVIGGITPRCARRAMTFYRTFVRGACVTTNARAAEMVKLVENSYRDVNIAFANELSVIADSMDINVWDVISLANRHPRVNILQPGPGVGGHCIAVDPWFLVHANPAQARMIRTARHVNDDKTDYVIARSQALIDRHPGKNFACLGLAFKPDIDDFRESPALRVAEELGAAFGDRMMVVEPHARQLPASLAATGARLVDIDRALAQCEIIILLVDHAVFKSVPVDERSGKIIYDTRGIWHESGYFNAAAR